MLPPSWRAPRLLLQVILQCEPELSEVKTSQRYCVIRIWATKRVGDELPVFIITEKAPMLDSVTFCHRAEKDCADWAGEQRAIYELHCYAVPDSIADEHEAEKP